MILCLDVGNSQIFGGLFLGEELHLRFRYSSKRSSTSDELGVFLRNVFREHDIDYRQVTNIVVSSVVPALDYTVNAACIKYLSVEPLILQHDVPMNLTIEYEQPAILGMDRVACAVGAIEAYPDKNIIVVDFGTATTYCAISKDKRYLGGVIQPGMQVAMESLYKNTAKLPSVPIVQVKNYAGKTTQTNIQAGLYFGQIGATKEILQGLSQELFAAQESPVIVATGGFSHLFREHNLFDVIIPDLVLFGIYAIWESRVG